ncbi:phage tail tape measure protein [Lacticaseibacillus kribbianus]|uniref:phage tail tape measure protein n=1 Tax=Lacticaseibacillus kribbianus TaxID=2926292 RepID=UPI001CD314BA|nr:phage tail tape measure protein [Lacticaseibacillus kribbianus]
MAGNIKGITIEINGDTTKLDKALSDVNKQTTSVNKELRQVDNLLKFNPGNTELVAQKQQLLAKQIEQTSSKLKTLKDAQAQVEAQFKAGDIGEDQYRAFQREIVATEGKLKSYQGQLAASKSEQAELESSTKQLGAYFEASGKDVSDFTDVLGPKLTSAVREGKASSAQLNDAINKIGRTVTNSEGDFDKFKGALKGISDGGSIDVLRGELKQLSSSADSTGDALEGIGKKLDAGNLMDAADSLSGITDKASELAGEAVDTAKSLSDFQTNAERSFGMSADSAQQLADVVKDVMENGIVPDLDDASDAVMSAKNYFWGLNQVDLTDVSNKLAALTKTFGGDFSENANAAKKLMDNFGLSANDAFDLLTAGYQQGLNNSDDFLDTINEYSPLMKNAGISAGEFTDMLAIGMQNGAMNTDKTADAVKEFQIRLGDGTFKQNLGSFSGDTKKMFGEWQKGKATVTDVMKSVGKDLNGMNPQKQQAAISLLGTQYEDMGTKASIALLSMKGGMGDVAGAADSLNKKSPGEQMAADMAKLKDSLADAIQPIIEKITDLVKWFNKLSGPAKQVSAVVGIVTLAVLALVPAIVSLAVAFMSLDVSLAPFIAVIVGIIAVISAVVLAIMHWGAIVDWLKGVWKSVSSFFSDLWATISQAFSDGVNSVVTFFTGMWTSITSAFTAAGQAIAGAVTPIFQSISDTIKTIWGGITSFFSSVWEGIKSVFTAAITIVAVIIGTGVEIWKATIGRVMKAIKGVIVKIWNGIKAFFGPILSAIGNLISKAWGAIKSVTSSVWNGIKSKITTVVNGIKSVVSKVWNGINSVTSSVFNAVKSTVSSIWNGIKSVVTKAVNGVKSTVLNVWNGIKSVTSRVWNGIKNAIMTPINAARDAVKRVVDAIKGFFHFSISWPHIPMPHFGISPAGWKIGDLLKGKLPHLSINWHAAGGIFNKPTLFAGGDGAVHGVGEAGPEAVAPISELMGYVQTAVANTIGAATAQQLTYAKAQNDMLAQLLSAVVEGVPAYVDWQAGARKMQPEIQKITNSAIRVKNRRLGNV